MAAFDTAGAVHGTTYWLSRLAARSRARAHMALFKTFAGFGLPAFMAAFDTAGVVHGTTYWLSRLAARSRARAHMARLNAFAGFGLGFFLQVLRFADAAGAVILVARLYFNRCPPAFACLRSQECK